MSQARCLLILLSVVAAGCPACGGMAQGDDSGTTTAAPNSTSEPASSGVGSTSLTSNSTSTSLSSTGSPSDPCPVGAGVDWPRIGAYLNLANEQDFAVGPQDLTCSVERALNSTELGALAEVDTVGAVELMCELPGRDGSSVVYLGVTLPEAVPSLEDLVGLQGVSVLFHYGGPLRGKVDIGIDTISFGLRDEVGPLFISQFLSCDGPFVTPDIACGFYLPPFMVSPAWSDPLPEPRLAPAGCGTRMWENEQAPLPGVYDMSRLAVRFGTDRGMVDALDHHVTPLDIDGSSYEFFAIEAVGEVEDPAVLFDSGSYTGSIRFLIIRAP